MWAGEWSEVKESEKRNSFLGGGNVLESGVGQQHIKYFVKDEAYLMVSVLLSCINNNKIIFTIITADVIVIEQEDGLHSFLVSCYYLFFTFSLFHILFIFHPRRCWLAY